MDINVSYTHTYMDDQYMTDLLYTTKKRSDFCYSDTVIAFNTVHAVSSRLTKTDNDK